MKRTDKIIANRVRVAVLLSFYEPLLTVRQRSIIEDYYSYDLSLSEIGLSRGISRAAVSASLAVSIAKMEDADAKLGLISEAKRLGEMIEQAKTLPVGSAQETLYQKIEEEIKHGI